MIVRVVALYPVRLSAVAGRPGVRFRKRKKKECTLIPCRIESRSGRSVAVPDLDVPEGAPAPMFKAQLEVARATVEERQIVCIVLPAESGSSSGDPEQHILAPIFDDGRMMIYEFRRAFVFSVTRRREIELRLVAVHGLNGTVGTKTVYRFHARYMSLAQRCSEYLAGAIDLFPAPPRYMRPVLRQIPEGEANLAFEPGRTGPRVSLGQ